MLAKLTLTIDKSVIAQAKEYARKKNKSISLIVEEYLKNVIDEAEPSFTTMTSPITDSISGMFHDNGKSYKDMKNEALLEKYL
ncbi:MAG: DUF6364 family protein [Treponema sp.]